MTWVKICANTNLEDARAAVEAGADALGFIFAPSARRISPKDARKIIAELPPAVEKIGVFVNQAQEIVLDTVETAGLTGVQLHGGESVAYARELRKNSRGRGLRIIKGVHMTTPDGTMGKASELAEGGDVFAAVLFDSSTPERGGGTGKTFDWQQAVPVVRLLARKFPVIIAGGLTPSNVGEAIALFQPWGVDVVSGVEREKGKKDHQKVRAFVEAVKGNRVIGPSGDRVVGSSGDQAR